MCCCYFKLYGAQLYHRMWIQVVTLNVWITKKHAKLPFEIHVNYESKVSLSFVYWLAVCEASPIWHMIRIKQTKKLMSDCLSINIVMWV